MTMRRSSDWRSVDVKLTALKDVIRKVRNDVNNLSGAVDRLDGNVAALDLAVLARDRQYAMRQANQVTLDVSNMTTAYKLSVPVEVTRLDYYGRELEVWAQGQDTNRLKETALEMGRIWDLLRPSVEARSATEAKRFDGLVEKVESAETPDDYEGLAPLVLDEVDDLKTLFP